MNPGAVLFAKNIERVAAFYRELLGMSVGHAAADIVVLEAPQVQMVIHGIPKRIANAIVITSPPMVRDQVAIKLIFPVKSIAEARVLAEMWGGRIYPAGKEFVARGFRACDGVDPEGNVIQLREPAS